MLKLNDYYYNLPVELIAEYPADKRTNSKLLCVKKHVHAVQHKGFSDIIALLNRGDLLVLNETKVIPARMFGTKETGGKVEIFLERIISDKEALVHLRASKGLKVDSKIIIKVNKANAPANTNTNANNEENGRHILLKVSSKDPHSSLYKLTMVGNTGVGSANAENTNLYYPDVGNTDICKSTNNLGVDNIDCLDFRTLFQENGKIPLPPYIKRLAETEDDDRYQTVYAAIQGSVAAPTAGLHFDTALLQAIKAKGVEIAKLTLHIGAGTFVPVKVENIQEHKMHSELVEVNKDVCELIAKTKANNKRVIAVGTTVVRALESAALSGEIKPYSGDTNIFITPGFKFNIVDAMITNFHLPKSTLLMLVAAFAGFNNIMTVYKHAIEAKYRFYSYGDAMFIE